MSQSGIVLYQQDNTFLFPQGNTIPKVAPGTLYLRALSVEEDSGAMVLQSSSGFTMALKAQKIAVCWEPNPKAPAPFLMTTRGVPSDAFVPFAALLSELKHLKICKTNPWSGPSVAFVSKDADIAAFGPVHFNKNMFYERFIAELKKHCIVTVSQSDPTVLLLNDESDQIAVSRAQFSLSDSVYPVDVLRDDTPVDAEEEPKADTPPPRPAKPAAGWNIGNFLSPIGGAIRGGGAFVAQKMGDFLTVAGDYVAPKRTNIPGTDQPIPKGTRIPFFINKGDDIPLGKRERPLSMEEFVSYFEADGSIKQKSVSEFKQRVFYGGMSEDIRADGWKFLFGMYPYASTYAQREEIAAKLAQEYGVLKGQWKSMSEDQMKHCRKLRQRIDQIDKDVPRTNREYHFFEKEDHLSELRNVLVTYIQYNQDLGYMQGMNDIAAEFLSIFDGDEVATFWCYKNMMDRIGQRFSKDPREMHVQLSALSRIIECVDPELYHHFEKVRGTSMPYCFRWLLVMFRREFSFDSVKRLWESIFADRMSPHFDLFIAAAMVLRARARILAEQYEHDMIMHELSNIAGTLAVEPILIEAEYIYYTFLRRADVDLKRFIFGVKELDDVAETYNE